MDMRNENFSPISLEKFQKAIVRPVSYENAIILRAIILNTHGSREGLIYVLLPKTLAGSELVEKILRALFGVLRFFDLVFFQGTTNTPF